MKYELWANKDETNIYFLGVEFLNYEQNLRICKIDEEIEIIWTTEAETYNEAMQKFYDCMNWGTYKPFDD